MSHIIRALPFFKQSSLNDHLIHALDITETKETHIEPKHILIAATDEIMTALKTKNF